MKESYTKHQYYQIDYTHIQHWQGSAPVFKKKRDKKLAPGFIRMRNPTVYLTTKGNLKSQCFFSKNNSLHTYVGMYSISTESHMPRDMPFLFYDQYRYYHFLEKQDNHTGLSRQRQDNNNKNMQSNNDTITMMKTYVEMEAIEDSDDGLSENEVGEDMDKDYEASEDDDEDYSHDDEDITPSQLAAIVTPPGKAKKRKGKAEHTSTSDRGGRGCERGGGRGSGRGGNATSTASRDGNEKLDRGRPLGSKNKPKTPDAKDKKTKAKIALTSLGKTASSQSSLLTSFKKTATAAKKVVKAVTPEKTHLPTLGKAGQVPIPNLMKQSVSTEHAPMTKAMVVTPDSTSQEIVAKTYIIRAVYRRRIKQEPVDAVDLMRNMMARLIQYNESVQMLPYDDKCTVNPLVSAKDIPSEVEEFNIYVPKAVIHQKSKVIKMNFRISANKSLYALKLISPIRNYLEKYNIYLDQTFLGSIDNAKIGGIVMSHVQYTRRDEAAEDLNKRINESESSQTPIQLTPHTIWNANGTHKISTKFLAVECARHHTREVRRRIFQKLFNLPESMKYSNTRLFNFIPFSASGVITDQVIRSGIYLQNQFLSEATAVTMVKIAKVDWTVPSTSITFRELVLTAEGMEKGTKLFSTVEQGAGSNKIHLVTTKTRQKEASKWADEFTNKMEMISSSAQYWKEQTGFISPPERINRSKATDAHQAYANFLGQTFEKCVGKAEDISAPSSAPQKPSYCRVVYGNIEGSDKTTTTNITETSTITSDETIPQTSIDDFKNNILDQMNQMQKKSEARVDRIENGTKKYDEVLQAIMLHSQQKDKEFEKYEDRLNLISEVGTSTAAKVDKTSIKVDMTNAKVDKLGLVFKKFIQEMALHGTTNPNNMNAIANLLDEVEEVSMEIDEEVIISPSPPQPITQPSPGTNTDSALGGEGIKK